MKNPLFDNPPSVHSGIRPSRKIMRDEMIKRMEAEAKANEPPTSVKVLLDDALSRHIQYAHDKMEADGKPIDDDDIRHHEEARIITSFYKELKKFAAYLEKEYHNWVWYKDKVPPQWMIKDAVINEILKTTRFWAVLMALQQHSKSTDNQDRAPVYFVGTTDFYDKIAVQLKISRISVQHYVYALCRIGVIKRLDKKGLGKGNLRAYQTGWIQEWEGRRLIRPLLKKELRKLIREFTLPTKS